MVLPKAESSKILDHNFTSCGGFDENNDINHVHVCSLILSQFLLQLHQCLFFAFCSEGTQDKPDQKVKDHSYVEATFEKYEVEEYEIDSTKAETISRIERMADMNRIKQVIEEMGIKIKHPTILHTDNIGSVINIENGNNWDMGENGSLKWLEDLKLQDIKKALFKDQ